MPFSAIATDYDETLAHHGRANEQALAALRDWRAGGRRLLLITGRELESLRSVCPDLKLFDLVVAENGAVLYFPATRRERPLASPPPPAFLEQLRGRGVHPLSVGRCVVATLVSQEPAVRSAIRELRLDWNVTHNRESIMALPNGIDKGSGLSAAVAELGIASRNVMGIGDAENDDAFLAMCGLSVVVANAIPEVKKMADLVTRGACGAGVVEAVHHVLSLSAPAIDQHS